MFPKYEKQKLGQGYDFVIGCDEVGRGCLAGPVVAAAVVLPTRGDKLKVESLQVIRSAGIKDSKLLSPNKREKLSELIKQHAWWRIGVVPHSIIDRINIHYASLLAMRQAVKNLLFDLGGEHIFFLVVDGKFPVPDISLSQEAVVDADAKILSVAAASIVAKVYRDNLMRKIHVKFPHYGLDRHKGYATFQHREAIRKYGLSEIHRLTFCKEYIR